MTSNGHMVQIEKLQGQDNYATWSFAVRTYLEHEELWKCVEDGEEKFTKSEDTKARSKIVLLVDSVNYIHIQESKTAKEVWSNLRKAFDDSGLTRKVGLLRELINTDLEGCGNVETYVNKVITCAHKLRNIGFMVDDEWLGTLLLAGLPESYRPMIMAMESSGVVISTDLVKTKILQDVKNMNNSAAFYSSPHKGNMKYVKPLGKGPRCFKCNRYGHISKTCHSSQYSKQNKDNKTKKVNFNVNENSSSFVAAFAASPDMNKGCWYLDSGAAMHMTNNRDWIYDYGPAPVTTITVANKGTLTVNGCGKANLKSYDGVSKQLIGTVQVKNVLYVPGLAANLLSIHQITRNNCEVKFDKDCCKIYHDSKLVMTGYKQNESFICNTYLQGKQTRQPFKNEGIRDSRLLDVINRSPTISIDYKSPRELWTGKKRNIQHMRIFGCRTMAHIPKEKHLKWDNKAREFIFVGYSSESKGYRLYDPY
ncbi:hypothetical protein O3G_MSEX002084 [Manduca sexta]|uniref:CCHC-type domain-containing protein n=1 Tax=Manduca sexta TaxID=7130 RepID=A0A921YM74_MANSE|nr:hypothetical protein O3G_MSEX002084 [Manduca sexta]